MKKYALYRCSGPRKGRMYSVTVERAGGSQPKSNDSRSLMSFATSFSIGNMATNWLLPPGLGAPVAIEQRANAFAASFLMPTWLLRDALSAAGRPTEDEEVISVMSAGLRVSRSSLIDRLYNLGELTFDDRLRLRSIWTPTRD